MSAEQKFWCELHTLPQLRHCPWPCFALNIGLGFAFALNIALELGFTLVFASASGEDQEVLAIFCKFRLTHNLHTSHLPLFEGTRGIMVSSRNKSFHLKI